MRKALVAILILMVIGIVLLARRWVFLHQRWWLVVISVAQVQCEAGFQPLFWDNRSAPPKFLVRAGCQAAH